MMAQGKLNIEHRTSNIEHRMEKMKSNKNQLKYSLRVSKRLFDRLTALSGVEGLKKIKIAVQGLASDL